MLTLTFREFLEASTIHGLCYISNSKNAITRSIWIVIVCVGFICAGIIIDNSFSSWREYPVATSIETFPISQAKFPRVTVCPPERYHTALNYDLVALEKIELQEEVRNRTLKVTKHDHQSCCIKCFYWLPH